MTDTEQAVFLATQYTGLSASQVVAVSPVFSFSPEYDFRNKRLPVWRVDYAGESGHSVFVDPATGMLVDKTLAFQRVEAWVFSWLHKWNFMNPSLGMAGRDILMSFFLLSILLLAGLGITQYQKKYRKSL